MDPLELGKLLILLAGLAGLYLKLNQGMRQLAGKGEAREITNNPLHTQSVSRPATMEDLNVVALRVLHLERRFESHMAEMQSTTEGIEQKVSDLRDRLDDKLTSMDETLREMSRSLGRLEGS